MSRINEQKAIVLEKGQGQDALEDFSHFAYGGMGESVRT